MSYWQRRQCRVCKQSYELPEMVNHRHNYCKFCWRRYQKFYRLFRAAGKQWHMSDMHRCRYEWRKVSEL